MEPLVVNPSKGQLINIYARYILMPTNGSGYCKSAKLVSHSIVSIQTLKDHAVVLLVVQLAA
jgi:hypothetical protein